MTNWRMYTTTTSFFYLLLTFHYGHLKIQTRENRVMKLLSSSLSSSIPASYGGPCPVLYLVRAGTLPAHLGVILLEHGASTVRFLKQASQFDFYLKAPDFYMLISLYVN